MLKSHYGESGMSLDFHWLILLASVTSLCSCFPAFQCLSTSSLSPKRNCAVLQVCEKWLEKSNLTKRGVGSMGEGLPVLGGVMVSKGIVVATTGTRQRGADGTDQRQRPTA